MAERNTARNVRQADIPASGLPGVDRMASVRNPIIGRTLQDTLHQAACVAAFLARVHADRADWQLLADTSDIGGPDGLSGNEERGLALLQETLAASLVFELEGREGGQP